MKHFIIYISAIVYVFTSGLVQGDGNKTAPSGTNPVKKDILTQSGIIEPIVFENLRIRTRVRENLKVLILQVWSDAVMMSAMPPIRIGNQAYYKYQAKICSLQADSFRCDYL